METKTEGKQMPQFVTNAYGQVQKVVNDTYLLLKDTASLKRVQGLVDGYWTKYAHMIKVEPYWSNVQQFSTRLVTQVNQWKNQIPYDATMNLIRTNVSKLTHRGAKTANNTTQV